MPVMPGRFGNRELRPTKRRLSTYEKSSLVTTEGRALVLPGSPNTEIEELAEAGYDACRIFGVEQDEKTFRELQRHYHDSAHLFHDDVFKWMSRAQGLGQYSYIHLDFCGHFTSEQAVGMQEWKDLAAPEARLRVSVFRGRRSPLQFDWEETMQHDLLLNWCQLAFDTDEVDQDRWVAHDNQVRDTLEDTTKIIVALMTLTFFFGVTDYRTYLDNCRQHGNYLPSVEGRHVLTGIHRFIYNEPGSPNHMFTVWVDLKPMPTDPMRHSTQWTLNELNRIFDSISYHVPIFNPATV